MYRGERNRINGKGVEGAIVKGSMVLVKDKNAEIGVN